MIPRSGRSLEKGMAPYSNILAWRIPWTEEPGGLQSTGSKESDTTEPLTLSLLFLGNYSHRKKAPLIFWMFEIYSPFLYKAQNLLFQSRTQNYIFPIVFSCLNFNPLKRIKNLNLEIIPVLMFSDFLKIEKFNIQFSLCNKILWEFEDKLHDFFTWVLLK